MTHTPVVDVNVVRFNHAGVALVSGLAFVLQSLPLVVIGFVILALSWFGGPKVAPLTRLYTGVIRPRFQPGGPTEFEPAAPPRFAQAIGMSFLGAASSALSAGWDVVGWTLVAIVAALALLSATTRICVGCIVYQKVVAR